MSEPEHSTKTLAVETSENPTFHPIAPHFVSEIDSYGIVVKGVPDCNKAMGENVLADLLQKEKKRWKHPSEELPINAKFGFVYTINHRPDGDLRIGVVHDTAIGAHFLDEKGEPARRMSNEEITKVLSMIITRIAELVEAFLEEAVEAGTNIRDVFSYKPTWYEQGHPEWHSCPVAGIA